MSIQKPWYETAWGQATDLQFIPEWGFVEERTKEIIERAHLKPGMIVLDMACGSGAETTLLAVKGYKMTGVDFSPAMIDIAKRIASEKMAEVEWSVGDMRKLDENEQYDLVMIRDVIFGVFDHRTNLDVLKRLFKAVKKGGYLLLEIYNKEAALERKNVEGFLTYNSINNRFEGSFEKKTINGNIFTDFASNEFFTIQEWRTMFSDLGLEDIQFYPSTSAKMRGLDYNRSLVIDVAGKRI